MKKENQIPLQDRLHRLAKGESSDSRYDVFLIKSMAKMQIYDYLSLYPEEWNQLMDILQIPFDEGKKLTYVEVAVRLQELYRAHDRQRFDNAVGALLGPILVYYEIMRRRDHYAEQ